MAELHGYPDVGPVKRPNGYIHHPRAIGDYEDLALMESWREDGEFAFISGPPGTGKNSVVEGAFEGIRLDGQPRRRPPGAEYLVCSRDTTEADLVGSWVKNKAGQYVWVNGPLTRAVIQGVPFMADEMLLSDTRTFAVVYPLLDGRGTLTITANPELEPIAVTEGFYFIGAGNPDVPGAQFSEAMRDRLVHHIEIGTDWKLCQQLGVPTDIISAAKKLDQTRIRQEINWSPQMRALLAFRDSAKKYGEDFASQGLLAKTPAEDRAIVADVLAAYYPGIKPLRATSMRGRGA